MHIVEKTWVTDVATMLPTTCIRCFYKYALNVIINYQFLRLTICYVGHGNASSASSDFDSPRQVEITARNDIHFWNTLEANGLWENEDRLSNAAATAGLSAYC